MNSNDNQTFGEFIIAKRREHDMSARYLAKTLGISAVYLCDIEKDRKNAVSEEFYEKLKNSLCLTEDEVCLMYDLAALARNAVSTDLRGYIMEHEIVRATLRTAKKKNTPDEDWEEFLRQISHK